MGRPLHDKNSVGANPLRVALPKHCAGNDVTCEIMIDQS